MGATKHKHRKGSGRFLAIPHVVMQNADYINLSYKAKALLYEAALQYNGKNNGDITLAWSILKKRGFKSQDTLHKAIHELMKANLILRTREGWFQKPNNRCALYAITWQSIDSCSGKDLEVAATNAPYRAFSLEKKKINVQTGVD